MLEVKISVTPLFDALRNWVKVIEQEALKDLSVFFAKWAKPIVIEEIARVFVTEGYGTWSPLSERYSFFKHKYYPGRTILRRTDAYFKAATGKGAGNTCEITPEMMVWGIDIEYFRATYGFPYPLVHEKGSRKINVPARPVFDLLEDTQLGNTLVASLKDYLEKVIQSETHRFFS